MNIEAIHNLFLKCSSVSIDTRKITPNSLFVAIKGDRFDANTFAKEALEKKAAYVVIDNPNFYIDERTILVQDSLTTLQELAKFHRNYLKLPIIALTGSNGKTTTKELINCVLSKKYSTKATVGNLNNHIGVPLTLLSFDSKTEIGIVEMGANHQKEIAFLCEIAQPDFGYITNFGKAHLEGFGGVEGVIKGKSEMYSYLLKHNKTVFINLDDSIQVDKTKKLKTFSFGFNKAEADVNITNIKANPFVAITFSNINIQTNLIGLYNANNINAAVAIGKYFNVPDNAIKSALEGYVPENNRSQLIYKNTNEIILDAYNANPSSMAVAIANFIQLNKKNKIVILGDMFELGTESIFEHKMVVDSLLNEDETTCYFIGKDFYLNKLKKNNFHFYDTFDSFSNDFKQNLLQNKMMLIKGSRGMALERVLELI
ncbi:UDP-N-acetylmuramoyl-tripeptide--D-alanyl-D-alanine ligase [Flavobacterium luteum]|uniref:UDP-N-acetylmuramoyl-tripeptide--D-alanyl-D-alanine ligase n=1 Tax=Flavobacterium luteum TaxID=2026654 RepID=A0A7J5A7U3_9FLAO|nr:UDP-N-acetylmuramoyl-tripeptide--D-alanyl-D-alanine ligase [Flavobacterium luteum]KAB1153578.1 UDP-N-acetylmuramoyl-tripeptide--D-alanyl-D-alanine ligase [Flavobacterium luteum]